MPGYCPKCLPDKHTQAHYGTPANKYQFCVRHKTDEMTHWMTCPHGLHTDNCRVCHIEVDQCPCQGCRRHCRINNINGYLRRLVTNAFQRVGAKTGKGLLEKYLGTSIDNYRDYIQHKFLADMTWLNNGKSGRVWQIDHYLPLHPDHPISHDEQLLRLHYSNTRPIWIDDNQEKGNTPPQKIKLVLKIKKVIGETVNITGITDPQNRPDNTLNVAPN